MTDLYYEWLSRKAQTSSVEGQPLRKRSVERPSIYEGKGLSRLATQNAPGHSQYGILAEARPSGGITA